MQRKRFNPDNPWSRALKAIEKKHAQAAQEKAGGEFAKYRDDPVGFARDVLRVKLWGKQADIALAIARGDRVAVKSGHKIGKSTSAAAIAWWWACTRARGRVILSSASDRQVRSILWREIKRLHRERDPKFSLPKPAELPGLGVQFDDGREIVGFSTNEPERMAGISGDELLFILDEASGIRQDLFDAIEGNTAGGGRILMLSNPTQTSGYFYEAFTRARSDWACFTISSEETPNVVEGRDVIPGLATRSWVEKRKRAWGEDSPRYQVRVRGNFPTQGDDSVVPMGLVKAAMELACKPDGALFFGVDVARFGDDETVFAPRRGNHIDPLIVYTGLDTSQVAGRVVVEAQKRRDSRPVYVFVDTIGVGGGVADALRAMRLPWMRVIDVNGSERANNELEYMNKRAEMLFGVTEYLKAGGSLPNDEELDVELTAMRYMFDNKGRLKVESKDDIKERLGRSPDRADAVALCCCPPPVPARQPSRDFSHLPPA